MRARGVAGPGHLPVGREVLEVGPRGGLDPPLRVLDPADLELLVDHALDLLAVAAAELEQARKQHAGIALEARVPVGEFEPGRRAGLDDGAVGRDEGALDRDAADVLSVAARVAVERAAHRARDAGRELEAGQLAGSALVDEVEKGRAAPDGGGGGRRSAGAAR